MEAVLGGLLFEAVSVLWDGKDAHECVLCVFVCLHRCGIHLPVSCVLHTSHTPHRDGSVANGKPCQAGSQDLLVTGADGQWLPPLRVQRSESLKEQEDGRVETPWWMYGPQVGHTHTPTYVHT